MKRDEKNLQSHQKIIDNALQEFSKKSYGEASLNSICSTGNISKGIIYHYFKDKDELYLNCVRECFEALTDYLDEVVIINNLSIEAALASYFDARITFFGEHPLYLGMFSSAILNPPPHLTAEIDEIAADLNAQSVSILTTLLKSVKLCPDITLEEVVEVFLEYQDFVNSRFQVKTFGENTLKDHEDLCRRWLQILLYGVIEREASHDDK